MRAQDRRAARADALEAAGLNLTDHQSERDGERAVARALEAWAEVIKEPRGEVSSGPILERFIRGPEGLRWGWIETYKNRSFEWCGAFAAWAWAESLSPAVRRSSWASTYRLRTWAQDTTRELELSEARPGDVLIIGERKSWGDHIAILERVEGGTYHTIEGNAHGTLGNGARGEGVVKRQRKAEEITHVYRPLEEDL